MDIVDEVTYRFKFEGEDLAEETRRAFVELFDTGSVNACLVLRHLTQICKWGYQIECNDPVVEAKMNSLNGVIMEIKKQLHMEPIELGEAEYENGV